MESNKILAYQPQKNIPICVGVFFIFFLGTQLRNILLVYADNLVIADFDDIGNTFET